MNYEFNENERKKLVYLSSMRYTDNSFEKTEHSLEYIKDGRFVDELDSTTSLPIFIKKILFLFKEVCMMNTTTIYNKFTGNQNAFNYAVYMMIGSYFREMEAISECYIQKLYLYYVENKKDRQYDFEDLAIDFTERVLRAELPAEIWQERVTVSFFVKGDKNYVAFQGARYTLVVENNYRGGRTKLSYKVEEYVPAIER